MKAVAIIGSPRKHGNTEILAESALKALSEEGIETEIVSLAGKKIAGCIACMACTKQEKCSQEDDLMPVYEKMKQADGIILASPVYYGSCTALLKGLMERTGFISRFNGERFKGKVGGPLVVARRAGQVFAVAEIDLWYHILGLTVPGSSYWNIAFGREIGEVSKDLEGIQTAYNFGKNMAFVMKKLKA
jgi:multimeric flavodoxin WrbA